MLNPLFRFFKDIIKYKHYIKYDVSSSLKAELSNTFLGYFWWLLDPFLNMGIYTFLFAIIFQERDPGYPVYVFSALLLWKMGTDLLLRASTVIRGNAGLVKQVYVPKFILPLVCLLTNFIKFCVGFILLFLMLFLFKIPLTFHIFETIVVVICYSFFFYSLSLIVTHFGVLFEDLRNILNYLIMFWFFVSPGMWQISMIPDELKILVELNPVASYFISMRNTLMYGESPLYLHLGLWFVFSLIIFLIGIKLLYVGDKNYSKVI